MAPARPPDRDRGRRGAATVELAASLPLLVVVTLCMVALVGFARDQILAQHAAREGARAAALGADRSKAVTAARAALPAGRAADVTVSLRAGRARVVVELPTHLPFGVSPPPARAQAVALLEPGPVPGTAKGGGGP